MTKDEKRKLWAEAYEAGRFDEIWHNIWMARGCEGPRPETTENPYNK